MVEMKNLTKAKRVSAVLEYDADEVIKLIHGALRVIGVARFTSFMSILSVVVYNLSLILNPSKNGFEPWSLSLFFWFAFFCFVFIYLSSERRFTGALLVGYMELLRSVEDEDTEHHTRHIALTRLQIENEGNADGIEEKMKNVGDLFLYSYNLVEHLRGIKKEAFIGFVSGVLFLVYYFVYHMS